MATSETAVFDPQETQIINRAFRRMGVIDAGEQPTGQEYVDARLALNGLLKGYMADGLHLWTQTEGRVYLEVGKQRYSLGVDNDPATADDVHETTVDGDLLTGETTITLTDVGSETLPDWWIGIRLDSGVFHWTQIVTVNASDVVVLDALPSAASDGNVVRIFASKMARPLRVLEARLAINNGSEIPVEVFSRKDYMDLPLKTSRGKTTQAYYDPRTRDFGYLYVWPTADSNLDELRITYERPIFDMTQVPENADIPTEWFDALSFGLAASLALEYGVNPQRYQMLKADALEAKTALLDWDREPAPVFFQPRYNGRGYR